MFLPIAELAAAVALFPRASAWWAALGALGLLVLFSAAIGRLARGERPDCRCFGQLSAKPVGWSTLARNAGFAGIALLVVGLGRHDPGLSVVGWLRAARARRPGARDDRAGSPSVSWRRSRSWWCGSSSTSARSPHGSRRSRPSWRIAARPPPSGRTRGRPTRGCPSARPRRRSSFPTSEGRRVRSPPCSRRVAPCYSSSAARGVTPAARWRPSSFGGSGSTRRSSGWWSCRADAGREPGEARRARRRSPSAPGGLGGRRRLRRAVDAGRGAARRTGRIASAVAYGDQAIRALVARAVATPDVPIVGPEARGDRGRFRSCGTAGHRGSATRRRRSVGPISTAGRSIWETTAAAIRSSCSGSRTVPTASGWPRTSAAGRRSHRVARPGS